MEEQKSKIKSQKSKVQLKPKKAVKNEVVVATAAKPKQASKKSEGLTVDVYGVKGTVVETMALPKELFGADINPTLMAQAVRVYLANQRRGTVSSKTRGEIAMTTAKWYRQKGTGRARHGAKSAPIFVHGGVAHGPKPRDYSLKLPQKMKQKALSSSLSSKLKDGQIIVVSGIETVTPKTKAMAVTLKTIVKDWNKKNILVVTPAVSNTNIKNVHRATRNIEGVRLLEANKLNTYAVLNATAMILMKDAIDVLQQTFVRKGQA